MLDSAYLNVLGKFDVVYSWGVLHHTGCMWSALANVAPLVAPSGKLFVAIYNDQGWISKYWTVVKKNYNKGLSRKTLLTIIHAPYLVLARWLVRTFSGKGDLERGMSYWRDMEDWLGGYPFEVAKSEQILSFYKRRGFQLQKLKTSGGRCGCNEYVFLK